MTCKDTKDTEATMVKPKYKENQVDNSKGINTEVVERRKDDHVVEITWGEEACV